MSKFIKNTALLLLFSFSFFPVMASHLIGDEFTYVFIGMSGTNYHYRVTLNLYEDCLTGEPEAIAQDNPAYLSVYMGSTLVRTDSVMYTSVSSVPGVSSGPCGTGTAYVCILKKTFIQDYYLPASTTAYTIAYERCCKNASLTNVNDPADNGSTYVCTIPATSVSNTSAVFTNYPPQVIGLHDPFSFDCSATDTDGDSLTYEICAAYNGGSSSMSNTKPWVADPPPYSDVVYNYPYSSAVPMSCSVPLSVDPLTGLMTGTPNLVGRYLVAVCCHEWRAGVMINTNRREFELTVIPISVSSFHPTAAPDTAVFVGESVHFRAPVYSSYLWTPSTYLDNPAIGNPTGTFPVAGTFRYVLRATSDSGCVGYDTVYVNVIRESEIILPNAFTPNNDGVNDYLIPLQVKNASLISFKVYNKFGQLMYAGTDGWDGTYHGAKQDTGIYLWEVVYTDNTGQQHTSKGNTTLIR